MADSFPSARMPNNDDTRRVDSSEKWMRRIAVPIEKLPDMLEMDDRSSVIFAEIGTVEKVYVDACPNDSVRCQMRAQVFITWRRVFFRDMVAMGDNHQRRRRRIAGKPCETIDRYVNICERPWCIERYIRERRYIYTTSLIASGRRFKHRELIETRTRIV